MKYAIWIVIVVAMIAGACIWDGMQTSTKDEPQTAVTTSSSSGSSSANAEKVPAPTQDTSTAAPSATADTAAPATNYTSDNTAAPAPAAQPQRAARSGLGIADINTSLQGKTITVRAAASNVKERNGTVFFRLTDPSDGAQIAGVMFKKTNNDNAGRKELLASGRTLTIKGEVDVYKGELEIKVWQVSE